MNRFASTDESKVYFTGRWRANTMYKGWNLFPFRLFLIQIIDSVWFFAWNTALKRIETRRVQFKCESFASCVSLVDHVRSFLSLSSVAVKPEVCGNNLGKFSSVYIIVNRVLVSGNVLSQGKLTPLALWLQSELCVSLSFISTQKAS